LSGYSRSVGLRLRLSSAVSGCEFGVWARPPNRLRPGAVQISRGIIMSILRITMSIPPRIHISQRNGRPVGEVISRSGEIFKSPKVQAAPAALAGFRVIRVAPRCFRREVIVLRMVPPRLLVAVTGTKHGKTTTDSLVGLIPGGRPNSTPTVRDWGQPARLRGRTKKLTPTAKRRRSMVAGDERGETPPFASLALPTYSQWW